MVLEISLYLGQQKRRGTTLSTCLSSAAPCTATNAVLTAMTVLQDYNSSGVAICNSLPDSGTSLVGVVIANWVVRDASLLLGQCLPSVKERDRRKTIR